MYEYTLCVTDIAGGYVESEGSFFCFFLPQIPILVPFSCIVLHVEYYSNMYLLKFFSFFFFFFFFGI